MYDIDLLYMHTKHVHVDVYAQVVFNYFIQEVDKDIELPSPVEPSPSSGLGRTQKFCVNELEVS